MHEYPIVRHDWATSLPSFLYDLQYNLCKLELIIYKFSQKLQMYKQHCFYSIV